MTTSEAIDKLETAALRQHVLEWGIMGPSHGDPGGYPYVGKACKSYIHDGYSVKRQDEALCDCPAKRHNEIVREAAALLRKSLL